MLHERNLWRLSIGCSLFFVLAIAYSWFRVDNRYLAEPSQLASQDRVEAFLAEHEARFGPESREPPIYVRTGVFIQSLYFVNARTINFSGYVWQVYVDGVHDGLSRGFVLPEAVDSPDTAMVEEAYRRDVTVETDEGPRKAQVIGWYVEATLRQSFDYTQYPLDHKVVWLRLWHADFDSNVILVPDLQAYDSTLPSATFGVEEQIVLGGWQIEESYFRYRLSSYDTDFGIADYIGQHNFPELYFNVVIKRDFLNAFVINLIPLLLVAALLFGVLMTITADDARVSRLGFDMTNVIAATSALFFVVMLAHIQLREQFESDRIVYLEYFYLCMYFVILAVAVNGYFVSLRPGDADPEPVRHDNLPARLLYWPVLLGAWLLITLIAFAG